MHISSLLASNAIDRTLPLSGPRRVADVPVDSEGHARAPRRRARRLRLELPFL